MLEHIASKIYIVQPPAPLHRNDLHCGTFDLCRSCSLTVWLVMVVAGGAAGFSLLWDWDLPTSSYFTWSTVSGTGMGDTAPADSLTFILLGGPVILGG